MKKIFYFTLKALSILKLFRFFSWLFGHVKNGLRSKSNQTIKFGQLTRWNMRNILFKKSFTKYGGEIISRPFYKKSKSIFYTVCFYCMPSWGLSKHIETKPQTTCLYFIKKDHFQKTKRGLKLVFSLSAWFLKRNISLFLLYWLIKFHCLVAFTSWDIEQYMYCNCLLTRFWGHILWN